MRTVIVNADLVKRPARQSLAEGRRPLHREDLIYQLLVLRHRGSVDVELRDLVNIARDRWGARIVSAEIESLKAGPRRLRVVGNDHHIEIGPLRRHIGEEGRSESLEVLGYVVSVLDLDAEHAVERRDASVPRIDRFPDQKMRCRSSASAAPR